MSTASSSAASFSHVRTCARHPDYLAPRFCTDCGTSLCSACAKHKAHKLCPSCNERAGKAASAVSATWFAYLFVDAVQHSWRAARLRVFFFVLVTGLLAAVGLIAVNESTLLAGGGEGVLLLPMASLLLGVAFAPALEVPLATETPLRVRMARALLGIVLPSALFSVAIAAPAWAAWALIETDSLGLVVAGILVGLLAFGVLGSTLLAFVYPVQAFVAVRGMSPAAAFKPLLRSGSGAVLMLAAAHAVISMSSFSAIDTVTNVVSVASLLDPWVGLAVGWPLCMASGAVMLFAMGAYGAASLRYVEDRLRLR
jgi:hypothetical protein